MVKSDVLGLVVSYAYVFAVLLLAELLGRRTRDVTAFTRKFVHIGVGMWIFGTAALFETWQAAVIPPLSFIVLNYISYRRDVFKAMESKDKRNLGTVYFPISFALIIVLAWSRPAVMVAGLMPMVWGDALAALVGERLGRRRYAVFGQTKTLEGSTAMFGASLAGVFLALLIFAVPVGPALLYALLTAAAATVIEAATPRGIDNLTVPLLCTLLLWLIVPA